MLAVLLAITLSHAASKLELLECANYTDKVEQAACVAEWEEKRAAKSSNSLTKPLGPIAQGRRHQCAPQMARGMGCLT